MAQYESETTQFLRNLLQKNPDLLALQKKNHATWWDKKQDLDQLKRFAASSQPSEGYAYFPVAKPAK